MATVGEVKDFLAQFRICVQFGAKVHFRQTTKNIQGLAKLNMTEAQAKQRVCQLEFTDYCGGPEADRDEDGKEIWLFGCAENATEVYIKIRLDPSRNRSFSTPVIRSFHPAEHPLCYPLKGGG
jgi:hypothetical protein